MQKMKYTLRIFFTIFILANRKEVFEGMILDTAKIIPEKKRILWLKSYVNNGGRV